MDSPHGGPYRLQRDRLYKVELKERYELIKRIGVGAFGTVSLARRKGQGQQQGLVAVKSINLPKKKRGGCLKLHEVQSLYSIPQHPSIVPIFEAFYDPTTKLFHMVMEPMQQNLYQLIGDRKGSLFDIATIRTILYQILSALHHCHEHNYFHRDVKPENVLVSSIRQPTETFISGSSRYITPLSTPINYLVKLADFGLARRIDSRPPLTAYVSTRWYRAPEVLLRSEQYSAPVDIWAFGSMAVELATLTPLFPGSDEMDTIWRILQIIGSPGDWRDYQNSPVGGGRWQAASLLAKRLEFSFPEVPPRTVHGLLGGHWPATLAQLVEQTLLWDPESRCTSAQAMQHRFFEEAGLTAQQSSMGLPRVERLSLLPWMDATQAPQAQENSISKRAQRNRFPATPEFKNRLGSKTKINSSETISLTHRQSWFSRKCNAFGRSIFDSGEISQTRTPADLTKAPVARSFGSARNHELEQSNHDQSASSSQEYAQRPQHPKTSLPCEPQMQVDKTSRCDISHDRKRPTKLPVRLTIDSRRGGHEMTRTNNAVLLPQSHNIELTSSRGPVSESNSSIGTLFSHLRKKHKKTGESIQNGSDVISTRTGCARAARESVLRPLAPLYSDHSPDHEPRQMTPANLLNHHGKSRSMMEISGTDSIRGLRASPPTISVQMSNDPGRPCDLQNVTMCPRTHHSARADKDRRISSAAAKEPFTKRKTSAHAHNCPTPTHASRPSIELTRPVPSYAKSTAASQRRASNIHIVAGAQVSSPITTSQKVTSSRSPAIPMNSFQRSLF